MSMYFPSEKSNMSENMNVYQLFTEMLMYTTEVEQEGYP